jgi:ectoine hydroxylase-related dioxygenase (phytanoyl-CoA dioxygenase family)
MERKILTSEGIDNFRKQGAICIRGLFSEWVDQLRDGIERNMTDPGPYGAENTKEGEEGRFFDDYCNWQRIPEFGDFVENSDSAQIAAEAMQSTTAQFFHDHVLVKEPGTSKQTPWHQDMPYYCISGSQTVSFWMPLDPTPKEASLELLAGSHSWPKMLRPTRWLAGEDFYQHSDQFCELPDIAQARSNGEILSWDMEPGDAILFDYRTVHGASGNQRKVRRRAFAHRWIGDDVTFTDRGEQTSPPFPGINLKEGDRLRQDWFPILWPKD